MLGERQLVEGIARLAALATGPFDVDELLTELCEVAGRAIEADGVGVMAAPHDGTSPTRTRYVHASAHVRDAERLQDALQEGPCREAVESLAVVAVEDVRTRAGHWGPFVASTLAAQMHSVLAVPLLSRGRAWGTLDLYRARTGPWEPEHVAAARLLADVAVSYLVMAHDRDEARAAQHELEHRSLHDGLTGLPNRTLLFDRMAAALARAARHHTSIAVAFVDLNDFKRINDTLGHAAGDHVLAEVARRLRRTVRAEDTLSRLAGDEFVVLCPDLPPEPGTRAPFVTGLSRRLRDAFAAPIPIGDAHRTVSASIGISVTPPAPDLTVEALLHSADLAMYRAKAEPGTAVDVHRHGW